MLNSCASDPQRYDHLVQGHVRGFLALRRERQEDYKFKVILGYIEHLRPVLVKVSITVKRYHDQVKS